VESAITILVVLIAVCILASVLLRNLFNRVHLPPLVAFVLFGFGVRLADSQVSLLPEGGMEVFDVLAKVGIICLLFRVGLESDPGGLRAQLGRAGRVWIGNVGLSFLLGYLVARYGLALDLLPSLFVGVAMTATSIGVTVRVWDRADRLSTPSGRLLLDVAELDDLSGVILMALLFGMAPVLQQQGGGAGLAATAAAAGGWILLKLVLFGGICYVFARYVEDCLTDCCAKLQPRPDPMLFLLAIGMLVAGVAGWIGFSMAIGAFFAGLIFSGDPDAVKMERNFGALHELFVPFFFIHVGLLMPPHHLWAAAGTGALLFVVAVAGKVLGGGLPALTFKGPRAAGLLGLSLVPRAEITMVVMSHGRAFGEGLIPAVVFSGMIWVVLLTCVVGTLLTRAALGRVEPRQ
jgi:Kef-type K+ transport system membrane component KefB